MNRAIQARAVQEADQRAFAKAAKRGALGERVGKVVLWFALLVGAVMFLLPFYIMLAMSLKTADQISTTSPWSWPKEATWENYRQLFSDPIVNFGLLLQNTVFLSLVGTIGVTLTAALVAFPFARLCFRGRDRLFLLVLSTMMLPGVVTMIPTYVIFAKLHWVDTFLPLTVPAFFGGGAFNIFLLRQFFMSIPQEMDEAARIDGATNSTIFWRVVLPNAGPAIATIAVFTFIGTWRDFMGPLLYLNDSAKQTLELGLRTFQTLNQPKWELLMAASVVVMLLLVIIVLVAQRYFVKGIVLTGGK